MGLAAGLLKDRCPSRTTVSAWSTANCTAATSMSALPVPITTRRGTTRPLLQNTTVATASATPTAAAPSHARCTRERRGSVVVASRVATIAAADAGRSSGAFVRQRMTSAETAGGSPGVSSPTDRSPAVACAATNSCALRRSSKGRRPVRTSYATTPHAYRSAR